MKKIIILSYLLICGFLAYSDYVITRGPNPGEIYFIGLTNTGEGIYYSTDFGETAICQDYASLSYGSICADKTEGVLYLRDFFSGLYISYDYGVTGTWELVNSGVKEQLNSGRIEGEIHSSFSKHSENYGQSFIPHSYNGFFGNKRDVTVDELMLNIGYAITLANDSAYLLFSDDLFENFEIIYTFESPSGHFYELSRGSNTGELLLYNATRKKLFFSSDYGNEWNYLDAFNFSEIYNFGLTGGRTDGEIYMVYDFVNMAWQNAHTYIFHSMNYGKTFEVFHPFAKGNEPVLANFSTATTEGEMPFTVDFCNFSIGDIQQYEWDFENDGMIDSYEETPSWTYQDTGYYSVRLTITGPDSSNTFLKEDYIHAVKPTGISEQGKKEIHCYPNPFSDFVTITLPPESFAKSRMIEIYNISGSLVRTISSIENKITWNSENEFGQRCNPGIYFVKLKNINSIKKIILTHKMHSS